MASAKTNIYILRLTGGNYYVGKSSDVAARFQEHLDGIGSAWTARYKPLAVERIIQGADAFEEDMWVKRYMSQKGIDKVRGGSYSSPDLDHIQIAALKHEMRGAKDKCFNCGSEDHFVADCSLSQDSGLGKCYRCGREGHYVAECYATTHVSDSPRCYRCNRTGHYASDCYAKTRVSYEDDTSDDSWD